MAPIHRLHAQDELKNCSADQYYSFLKNDMAKLQRICPQFYKSFQILAGDENGAGTIWHMKLAMDCRLSRNILQKGNELQNIYIYTYIHTYIHTVELR
ncbi:hypothetical protein MKW98_027335 [Papaver atlanticum]|uniref:Uncharacterized protein n=1 Tax=Papaver atlanticum TaxID=357466 RepID=A0AAD4SQQ9_9MAGN|nr:hypothetical protein MKW98_027335 [Papaver atlanticum]